MIEELESLLFDWDAGTLDDEGIRRLREILRRSSEAREYYLQQQLLTAALKLDADAKVESLRELDSPPMLVAQDVEQPIPSATHARASYGYWTAISASLLILILGGRVLYVDVFASTDRGPVTSGAVNLNPRGAATEATSSGIALLTRLVEVKWSEGQPSLHEGDSLDSGRLAIDAGYLQIEFFCGATIVVQGPAELDLKSAVLARVNHGRLRAHVPPAARGFSVEVDGVKVVDLGTEFGLAVSATGTDVQVFDGEVELHPARQSKQVLTTGEAITISENGGLAPAKVSSNQFVGIAALSNRANGQQTARFDRWRTWSEKVRRDSRLIAYYSFDQQGEWNRKLFNSVQPNDNDLDGAIVGARRVRGRWKDKSGLEFRRPADRVRVEIPGEFSSLTFACWAKIDSLDRWYNSLFLTDGYNQGEPHWQILDSGQLFFSVRHRADESHELRPESPAHQKVLSPPFWDPSLSGRWIHLATSYDADDGRVVHYLNGEVLHEELIDQELTVEKTRIGAASIGNWSIPTRPDAEFAVRNLNGTIDEFAIFDAALSPGEIKQMYDHGNP